MSRWSISLSAPSFVTTRWIDPSGGVAAAMANGWLEAGTHSFESAPGNLAGARLPADTYWLEVRAGAQRDVRPVVVLP